MAKDFNRLKAWIEKYAKEANLPIYKLANRAGISRATIYSWMIDKYRPDSEQLLKVAQVFAEHTNHTSEELFAEGLRQYTPRLEGRRVGATQETGYIQPRQKKG